LYQLPREWDEEDANYILVEGWISERDQEKLFEHTRKLREMRKLTTLNSQLQKEGDQPVPERKKERGKNPAKENWFFT
jgi:hypothetical protein